MFEHLVRLSEVANSTLAECTIFSLELVKLNSVVGLATGWVNVRAVMAGAAIQPAMTAGHTVKRLACGIT